MPDAALIIDGIKKNPVLVVLMFTADLALLALASTVAFNVFAQQDVVIVQQESSERQVMEIKEELAETTKSVVTLTSTVGEVQTAVAVINNDREHVRAELERFQTSVTQLESTNVQILTILQSIQSMQQ